MRRISRPEADIPELTGFPEPRLRLKELRKRHNVTQEQLAKMMHVSKGNISAWECGRCEMNYANLIAVSKIFKCSIDYLLGNTESEGKTDDI